MKRIISLLMVLMLVFLAVGCQQAETTNEADGKEAELATEEISTETTYPLTITDGLEREITIKEEPQNVVTMVPSMTETVFALGKGGLVVGRTDYCNYPEAALEVQSIGSMTEGNVEVLSEINPDVIFASTLLKADSLKQLEDLGFTVVVLASHDSIEGTYKLIEDTGLILNAQVKAAEVVDVMKTDFDAIADIVKDAEKKSVYYVVGFGEYGDYTATGETFMHQLIEMAGGENIASDATGWAYSLEKIVEKDPEFVICTEKYDTKTNLEAANGYKDLTAVKAGRLVEINNDLLDRQGPRLAEGLEALAKILHGDLFE